jgi:hypothetical protein
VDSGNRLFARATSPGAGEAICLGAAAALYLAQEVGISHLGREGIAGDLRRAVFFTTTLLLIGLALCLRRYVGAWLIAAGITLNFIPMAMHGGLMPVAYETVAESGAFPRVSEGTIGHQVGNSKDIVLRRADIELEPLTDRYVVTVPVYGTNIYSPGDFVVFGGVALAVAQVVLALAWPRQKRAGTVHSGNEAA